MNQDQVVSRMLCWKNTENTFVFALFSVLKVMFLKKKLLRRNLLLINAVTLNHVIRRKDNFHCLESWNDVTIENNWKHDSCRLHKGREILESYKILFLESYKMLPRSFQWFIYIYIPYKHFITNEWWKTLVYFLILISKKERKYILQ